MICRSLLATMVFLMVGVACGPPPETSERDGPEDDADAALVDAGDTDAPPARASTVLDLSSAGGRMQGGPLTLDFAIGHGVDQRRAGGGTYTLDQGAVLAR